jgi:heat shock protein HtpX
MHAYGLHSHIVANRWRSAFLIVSMLFLLYAITCVLLLFFGFFEAPPRIANPSFLDFVQTNGALLFYTALGVAIVLAVWFGVSVMEQKVLMAAAGGGYSIKRADNPELWNLLENMCASRGIPMPKFEIMDTPAVNAFASGFSKETYSITLTTGLIHRLNKEEIEGVIGHELTHIRNGDVKLMMIALLVVGIIGFSGECLMRHFFYTSPYLHSRDDRNSQHNGNTHGISLLIVMIVMGIAWMLSLFIKAALSRRREYLADAGAVELTKNPDAMISALRKIAGHSDIEGATSGFMEMCCDNSRQGFLGLMDTHPPIKDRIQALMRYAGGVNVPPSSPKPSSTPLDFLGPWDKVDVQDNAGMPEERSPPPGPRGRLPPIGPF